MALGLGRMFGFQFLENFNYPYISQSIQEFWRRWHISLSNWFRDYLYIPLGGGRAKPARVYFNLVTVFFLCGLWHGASWSFVFWGLYHGLFLVLERTRFGILLHRNPPIVRRVYTMMVVVVGWVFFRAEHFGYALSYLGAMFGFSNAGGIEFFPAMYLNAELLLVIIFGVIGSCPLREGFDHLTRRWVGVPAIKIAWLFAIFALSAMSLAGGTYNPFIYYRF
jgi:alginate O-acetyltransferase complex protein AlgI